MRQIRIILAMLFLGIVLTFFANSTFGVAAAPITATGQGMRVVARDSGGTTAILVCAHLSPTHAVRSYPATWIGAQRPPALR